MLICVGGLPGVGKTTVARKIAALLPATHLRIDAFEAALVRQGLVEAPDRVGPHGYGLALAAADTCLQAGTDVVVDAVFPVVASREPFGRLAAEHGVPVRWFRLVCDDRNEHRRRVETRSADLSGFGVPTWSEVSEWATEPWDHGHLVVDTAVGDPEATVLGGLGRPG
jgi:predicted kinase